MCGFVAIIETGEASREKEIREKALRMSAKIRHRGPDWSGIYSSARAVLAHERLAIVDPLSGGQPLYSSDGKKILAVNGEIYNHQDIRRCFAGQYEFKTGSDCEVVLALYEKFGDNFLEKLNGIFAFVLYDSSTGDYLVARDPIGVIPLYIGQDKNGAIYVASELKALEGQCEHYEPFKPGHYCSRRTAGKQVRWYKRDWFDYDQMQWSTTSRTEAIEQIRTGLKAAVKRQLMSDVPYGVLLSGGFDSSVISAIAKQYAAKRIETNDEHDAWWPRLHSFAVGLKGAPDLAKAREVAEHIGTVHHEINYTVQEGLDAIRDVIYHIET